MPPIDTQKRIAEYLDKKSIAIEKMINEKRRLIELLHEKKASFVNKVVIKGINSEQKYKDSGIDWLGEIPSSWEIKPFISLFKEKRNINYDGSIKNVLSLSYGKIIDRDVESNFGLLPASFNTYQIVEPGWIVFRLTDLQNDKKSLRTAIVLNKGIITSAYLAVEANKEIYPAYAAFLLYAYDLRKIFYSMGGGVRQSIGYAELKWLPIVMPHYDTQIKIADLLSKEVKKIDSAIQKTEEQISKLKEYHSSLIYATVTGKIKV
jgi:type I restriction enzyme S subunit